jgi:hypothetical protein
LSRPGTELPPGRDVLEPIDVDATRDGPFSAVALHRLTERGALIAARQLVRFNQKHRDKHALKLRFAAWPTDTAGNIAALNVTVTVT